MIVSFGFKINMVDECVYHKFSGSKHIFLVLYVDDILLATNDIGLLHKIKRFLSNNFKMVDLGDVSFVLGIKIYQDRSQGILRLSQKGYINKVLKRFCMQSCKLIDTLVTKGDKFGLSQCSKDDMEIQAMRGTSYALTVGSLMYAQVCIRPDIA